MLARVAVFSRWSFLLVGGCAISLLFFPVLIFCLFRPDLGGLHAGFVIQRLLERMVFSAGLLCWLVQQSSARWVLIWCRDGLSASFGP